ncbi:MAG: hypothetical protein ACYS29_18540 [Planctomycetota bacterium]|jgi:hypothetical protein
MLSRRAKWISLIVVLATIFAAALLLRYLIVPRVQRRRIESAIAGFESQPSQANADALAALISSQVATSGDAERIVLLLLRPKVTTREAYPLGEKPIISVERSFYVRFRDETIEVERHVWAEGEQQYGSSSKGGNYFGTRPQLLMLSPMPEGPGECRMEVRYKYAFTPSVSKTRWSWPNPTSRFPWNLLPAGHTTVTSAGPSVEPLYRCECVSNPELDEAMRAAFTYKKANMGGSYSTPAGDREYTGSIQVFYKDIPVAAVFKCAYEFPDGREVVEQLGMEEPTRLRAHTSGSFRIWIGRFTLEQPGRYSRRVILSPDPEAAYKDPAIKSIWNGELRFPISFTVESAR